MTPIDAGRRKAIGVLCAAAALMALPGCTTAPVTSHTPLSDTGPWSGRLSLTVQTLPPQRFYAGFTLTGSADAGQLALTGPLGSALAALRWQPGSATLIQNDRTQAYASLDDLTTHAAGAPIPVRALFDWLRGQNTPIDGWQADLSALAQGKLTAQRLYPPPAAQLRIVLDR